MKRSLIFVVLSVSLCNGSRLMCQFFNERTKSLEKYCEEFDGIFPANCTHRAGVSISPEANQVEHLKIGGCNEFIVLDAVERFNDVYTLDISFSQYESLDWLDGSSFKLRRLRKFNASHNEISSMTMLFENTPEIIEIDLSHNRLSKVNSRTFGRIAKLRRVNLSNNVIKSIDNDTFTNATNLELIDLSVNRFSSIPIFPNNKQLRVLRMEHNRITGFNYCLYTKMSAVSIYFSFKYVTLFNRAEDCGGKLVEPLQLIWDNNSEGVLFTSDGNYEIHFNAESFRNVYTFVAGRNSYANVVDMLPHFGASIIKIDLSGNSIGQLSAATFEKFNDLSTLVLHDTHLKEFDLSWLANQNSRLKALDVSENNLKFIKSVWLLDDFRVLREFSVAGNQLSNLAELIQHLRSPIEHLNLSGNFVGKLNATTFRRVDTIRALNLSRTAITVLESNPFDPLKDLRILDVSHNNLGEVNFVSLSSTLSRLNELHISHSKIAKVSEVISYLRSPIRILDVSGNQIEMLDIRTFEKLTNLEHLNLSNTNLYYFDFYALRHQSLLLLLDFSENKLQEVNFEPMRGKLKILHLHGNEISKVEHLNRVQFPHLKYLSIGNNQLSCDVLKQHMASDWDGIHFIGNTLKQKDGQECTWRGQAISDFFSNVYDKIKFW